MTDLTIKPDEINWRVGATYDGRDGKMGMLLGYIDARLAMDKLDALDANWSSHIETFRLTDKDGVRCSLTVNGVTREDVGTASDTEPLKGAVSDALKRAAVHFGIGRELYDLPTIAVQCEVKPNGKVGRPKALPVYRDGRWAIDSNLGWVRYDHEPIEQPQAVEEPAAKVTRADVAPAPATDDPMEDDGFFEAVLATTGGSEERPPERLTICPVHGEAKVKRNARGLYCATKLENGGWCDWSAKVTA